MVRGSFLLRDSLFEESASDALDVDFAEGQIQQTSFIDSGNDAIDFSGSVGRIAGIVIDGAGDKGISAGERSRITAREVVLRRCRLGVASKDLSQVEIDGLMVEESAIGLAVYRKNPEFGPGKMSVVEVDISAAEARYLAEEHSTLIVDSEKIAARRKNLARYVDARERAVRP